MATHSCSCLENPRDAGAWWAAVYGVAQSQTRLKRLSSSSIPQLAPCFSFVFQFVLWLVLFLTGRYNFWFPLFTGSIYCTLFLLDSFDFAYGCICIYMYSVTLFIVVINFCLYVGLLQFCGVCLFLSFFSFLFFVILIFTF